MKIVPESLAIVLAGYWNKYLLNPDWVGKNIFQEKSIKVEFALQMELPPRYTAGNVRFMPTSDRVQMFALKHDDETLRRIEDMAIRLVTTLIHTPMSGVGINLSFTEDITVGTLRELFVLPDLASINALGYTIQNTTVVRGLVLDGDIVNMSVQAKEGKVTFDFNFHINVKNAEEVADKIRNRVVEKRDAAIAFMRDVYGLELQALEGGEGDQQ